MWIRLGEIYIFFGDFVRIFMSFFICIEIVKIVLNRLCLLNYYYYYIELFVFVVSFRRGFIFYLWDY